MVTTLEIQTNTWLTEKYSRNSKGKDFFLLKEKVGNLLCYFQPNIFSICFWLVFVLANRNKILSKRTCLKIFALKILVWKSQPKRKLQGLGLLDPLKILLWLSGCYSTKADLSNPSSCTHRRLFRNANFAPGNLKGSKLL